MWAAVGHELCMKLAIFMHGHVCTGYFQKTWSGGLVVDFGLWKVQEWGCSALDRGEEWGCLVMDRGVMLHRWEQWAGGWREVGGAACCSIGVRSEAA